MDFQSIKLNRKSAAQLEAVALDSTSHQDIAIIGISVKLPLADTIDQFAHNLKTGRDCIRAIPSQRRQDTELYFKAMGNEPEELAFGEAAYLDEIDKFDYSFFKLSPREASLLDPNQRLFLQTAWRAIEDAGYGGGKLEGSRTGVYAGYGSDADYLKLIRQMEPEAVPLSMAGNVRPIIASRLSYLMDLRGPSFIVDSTCSSSLVAVHLACQAIRSGECDTAIVGGIQLHLIPIREYEVGIESSTSRARTFDDQADGTGTGEGVVVMMLKPLEQAIESRDHIYAVIKSSALNQDGGSVGITAPNAEAQEAVIVDAWKRAGIDPETIGYIETHGTATKLGDPIEVEGLSRAFKRFTDKKQFCAIGSLKSSVGHLDNAAGIAGLLKAVLSLKNKCIYPTLHFERPNRVIDFAQSPVYVNDEFKEWEDGLHPRRCGVSSFGISGTNCHVIVEEAPEKRLRLNTLHDGDYRLFVLSAQTETVLEAYVGESLDYLEQHPSIDYEDLCYTLTTGRGHHKYRIAIAATCVDELIDELRSLRNAGFQAIQDRSQEEEISLYADVIDRDPSQSETIRIRLDRVLETCSSSNQNSRSICTELGRLYVRGGSIPWNRLYRQAPRNRISFPAYPFNQNRCWVNLTDTALKGRVRPTLRPNDTGEGVLNEGHQEPSSFYHTRRWFHEPLSEMNRISPDNRRTILLLTEAHQDSSLLISRWITEGSTIIEAVMGDRYDPIDEMKFMIRDKIEDYERLLLDVLKRDDDQALHIVDLRFVVMDNESESIEAYEHGLNQTMYRLYRLLHALAQQGGRESIAMTLVTSYADEVSTAQTMVRPEQLAMIGLSKAVGWENPNFKVRWVDLDEQSDLVQCLCNELEGASNEYWTAYRQNKRYVERVDVLRLDEKDSNLGSEYVSKNSLAVGGVYLITGGLGSLGLLIASHLVKEMKGNIQLALIGRTPLPPRDQWAEWGQTDQDMRTTRAIHAIQEMEDAGAHIEVIQADISNEDQLNNALIALRERHGRIAGIVHAAGVSEGNLLKHLSEEDLRKITASKMTGTWLLDHLTRQDKPDFFVLFSSAITLVGGIGSGPYTAGNAYLDGYSAYRNRLGLRTLTINWPAWQQSDIAGIEQIDESKEMFCIMPQEVGIEAFGHLLLVAKTVSIQQVIVGNWNRGSHLFALGDRLPFRPSEQVQQLLNSSMSKGSQLNDLRSAEPSGGMDTGADHWTGTRSELEEEVIDIWKRVLGYDALDIHANFFEIGGDSILITRVHHYIDEVFPGLTTVADMFSYPTVAKITDYLYDVVLLKKQTDETSAEIIASDSLNEALTKLLKQVKQRELSSERATQLYRGMEVAHG
ncbi:SDR family NAD(P)-dependent oxidoreductase [Paenibacillus sp. EC2-1]|uniref:SDR family NAD(P)-dependent oxidoreductase n=1 Tax=Paenibacillus sp. EC2-1 TaxID=3388665 RepID=UPI003BEF1715